MHTMHLYSLNFWNSNYRKATNKSTCNYAKRISPWWEATVSISKSRSNMKLSFFTNHHRETALIPSCERGAKYGKIRAKCNNKWLTWYYLPDPHVKREWLLPWIFGTKKMQLITIFGINDDTRLFSLVLTSRTSSYLPRASPRNGRSLCR